MEERKKGRKEALQKKKKKKEKRNQLQSTRNVVVSFLKVQKLLER